MSRIPEMPERTSTMFTPPETTKKVDLHIACGRLGNKVILEMTDESAAWLVAELEAPTNEWKQKRGELAMLLRRACQ